MNSDNKEKAKSKKKKEPIEIVLEKLEAIKLGDNSLSSEDIAGMADALAAAKLVASSMKKTIDDGEAALKEVARRDWCERFVKTGHEPDLRRFKSKMGGFRVVQQRVAKVTAAKCEVLKKQGISISEHAKRKTYQISLSNASPEAIEKILASMKEILGEERYDNVVTEFSHVEGEFFERYTDIVRKSLREDEELLQKMISTLKTIGPVIQFSNYGTDLPASAAFDFALRYAKEADEKEAARAAAEAEARAVQAMSTISNGENLSQE